MEIDAVFGYAAILPAIATFGTFVTGMLFFQKGGNGVVVVVVLLATKTLQVARVVSYETSSRIGTRTGILIGVWLIAVNLLSIEAVLTGMALSA